MLQRLVGAEGTSEHAQKELNAAIDFYEALDVPMEWRYLPDNAQCCDGSDPARRFRAGGARGRFIWINSATTQADMALTAWHEAQHVMYPRDFAGTHLIIYPLQARIYVGLPVWAQEEAAETGRLLRARGVLR
jgi:hypothetical protein